MAAVELFGACDRKACVKSCMGYLVAGPARLLEEEITVVEFRVSRTRSFKCLRGKI